MDETKEVEFVAKTCGRPTSARTPCRVRVSESQRACRTHSTPEDEAYHAGYEAGWRSAWDAQHSRLEFVREQAVAEGRRLAKAEIVAEATYRTHTASGHQIVVVGTGLSYAWRGPDPLKVGDRIMLPANYVSEFKHGRGPWEDSVVSLGSSYQGALSYVIRKSLAEVQA